MTDQPDRQDGDGLFFEPSGDGMSACIHAANGAIICEAKYSDFETDPTEPERIMKQLVSASVELQRAKPLLEMFESNFPDLAVKYRYLIEETTAAPPTRDGAEGAVELFAEVTKVDLADAVKHLRNWTSYIDQQHRQKYADLIEAQAKLIAWFVNAAPPKLAPMREAICATPPEDLLRLANSIEQARDAYLNAISRRPGGEVEKRALEQLLWNDKGTFGPALRLAALSAPVPPADGARIKHGQAACNETVTELLTDLGFPSPAVAAEPFAWVVLSDVTGNTRMWTRNGDIAKAFAAKHLLECVELYAAPPVKPPVQPGADEREWPQPFTTAPRDGTPILARCNDHSEMYALRWDGEHWACRDAQTTFGDGLFLPNGDWCLDPFSRQAPHSSSEKSK